jgi:hypothetical protein
MRGTLATVVAAAVMAMGGARAQAAGAAGIGASLSQAAFTYIIDVAVPILEQKLADLSFPPISGEQDGFDYSLDNMVVNSIAANATLSYITPTPGVGLAGQLGGIYVSLSGDWSFQLHVRVLGPPPRRPRPHVTRGLSRAGRRAGRGRRGRGERGAGREAGASLNSRACAGLAAHSVGLGLRGRGPG